MKLFEIGLANLRDQFLSKSKACASSRCDKDEIKTSLCISSQSTIVIGIPVRVLSCEYNTELLELYDRALIVDPHDQDEDHH
jgi:hypothetical protein